MKRFKRDADRLGNYYIIVINDNGSVLMSNQAGVNCSLASVYNGNCNGTEMASKQVRQAALEGLDSLKRVTRYNWTELPAAKSDLTERQKDQIRSALNEMFNGIAEDCGLSLDQAPSAKAFMEGLLRKQPASNFVL
ncbi:hypothetical protein D3C75_224460 [compost metagenome]